MKLYPFLALILFSCTAKTRHNAEAPTPKHDSFFVKFDPPSFVSYELEKDSTANGLFRTWLNHNLLGSDSSFSKQDLISMTSRPSFREFIAILYDTSRSDKIRTNIETYRIPEVRKEYLYSIKDSCPNQLNAIANELLKKGEFDGVECLWEKADLQALPALNAWLSKVDTTNFFIMAKLAAFFHTKNVYPQRDFYLSKAANIPEFKKEFSSIDSLIKCGPELDMSKYNYILYGDNNY